MSTVATPPADPDLVAALRPVAEPEWPAFARAMYRVFGEDPTGPFIEQPRPTSELGRSLALVEDGFVAATAGIYSHQLTVPGGVVPAAGITWITVSPTHRRRGVLTAIMRRQLDEVHAAGREPVAALWAAEGGIYGRFGYAPAVWRGGITLDPSRVRLRADLPESTGRTTIVDLDAYRAAAVPLYDRLRRDVPGHLARDDRWWDRRLRDDKDDRNGFTERRYALHTGADGQVTGYASYRQKESWSPRDEPEGKLHVTDLVAADPATRVALWRFLLGHDLVRELTSWALAAEDPLRSMVADPRSVTTSPSDALWVRLVDVDRALAARRYPAPIDLVLEVRDAFCPWNDGRWRLTGHPAGGHCARTDRDPDLVLGIEELGAAYLGGVSLGTLHRAGRITEVSPGAVALASTSFSWPVAPQSPDSF
ncbi:Predicted acetyltransferase [Klenkia soli]|uniref:Predicted acetyltransferase n=1 Tax=Klenkia soli TaxID=1052260 RepID=A0A1H0KLS2_9ACTN|nr:GNAT family N-acetyltransferase [Klenkia soli]SDO56710.1 Predicted acetyltransferase [Klenkia soli]